MKTRIVPGTELLKGLLGMGAGAQTSRAAEAVVGVDGRKSRGNDGGAGSHGRTSDGVGAEESGSRAPGRNAQK